MNKKQLNQLGLILLTVGGGGLIAIASIKPQLQQQVPFLPNWFYDSCVVIGLVVTIAGIVLLLLPIDSARRAWRWSFGKTTFVPRAANREDLEHIHFLGLEEFGEVSPVDKMKEWYKINRNIFHVMQRVRRGKLVQKENLIGYYSVIPLKRAAVPFLEDDNFDGTKITNNLIIRERKGQRAEPPACIYIGGIAARGSGYARGLVVGELVGRLNVEKDRGINLIYSTPVTTKGLELLTERRFEPVKPPLKEPLKHIYKLDFSAE